MAGNNLQLTFAVARCDECKADNKLYEILRILVYSALAGACTSRIRGKNDKVNIAEHKTG